MSIHPFVIVIIVGMSIQLQNDVCINVCIRKRCNKYHTWLGKRGRLFMNMQSSTVMHYYAHQGHGWVLRITFNRRRVNHLVTRKHMDTGVTKNDGHEYHDNQEYAWICRW